MENMIADAMINEEQNAPKHGVFQVGKRFESYFNGELVGTSYNLRTAEIAVEKRMGVYVDGRSKRKSVNHIANFVTGCAPENEVENRFHINERFDFLEKAVTMVADGVQPSVLVSGAGGLGKTYTVRKALETRGLQDYTLLDIEEGASVDRSNSFVFIKGYSTAKALYRSLWNNNNSVIVFDDTDSILKDANAVNILKAALDSYDKRIISWGAEIRGDDDLPRVFEFTGQIIFITNMCSLDIDQAIHSRSLVIDLSMTRQEIVDRMRIIAAASGFLPEYNASVKDDALEFIQENKDNAKDLSLRTLISVCKIRSEFPDDWKNMASYITCN